jgi:hypothetical protein
MPVPGRNILALPEDYHLRSGGGVQLATNVVVFVTTLVVLAASGSWQDSAVLM